jgi:hypothetical protein
MLTQQQQQQQRKITLYSSRVWNKPFWIWDGMLKNTKWQT